MRSPPAGRAEGAHLTSPPHPSGSTPDDPQPLGPTPEDPVADPAQAPPEGSEQAGAPASYGLSELSSAALKGARSFLGSRVLIEIAAFLSVIAIARLVSPSQQGHAAVALVFPVLAYVLTFEGFGAALVQRKDASVEHDRTALTLSLLSGAALLGLLVLGAETVGRMAFGSETANLIILAGPTFLTGPVTVVSRARMMRHLDFKAMSRNDTLSIVGGTVATVVFAALGLGGRAIVLGAVATAVLDMILQFAYSRPVRPGWSRRAARDIASFGSFASLNGLTVTLLTNIDYIILAIFLSPRLVGIYYRSFQFGVQYQSKVTVVIQRMLFPLMSRAKGMDELRRVRERVIEFNSIIALPLLGLLVALAPTAVPLLYGHHWADAVVPTQILAAAGAAAVLIAGSEAPALALGETKALLIFTVECLITYTVALVVAAQIGLIAACIAASATRLLNVVMSQHLVGRLIGLPMRQLAVDAGPAAVSTVVASVAAAALREALLGLPPIAVLLICGIVGMAVYALALRIIFPRNFARFWRFMMRFARGRRSGDAPIKLKPLTDADVS